MAESRPGPGRVFVVAFVPGVTPDKWVRIWAERLPRSPLDVLPVPRSEQLEALASGRAQMCFVRLPLDRDGIHLIPLYRETPVALVPRDHVVAAFDEIPWADLADEPLLADPDETPGSPYPSTARAVEAVAEGDGILVLPQSLARLHARKDLVARAVTGLEGSEVGLAWPTTASDPRIETFIGIVRGRTARSSRS